MVSVSGHASRATGEGQGQGGTQVGREPGWASVRNFSESRGTAPTNRRWGGWTPDICLNVKDRGKHACENKITYLTLRETPCGTPMLTVAPKTLWLEIFLSAPYSTTVPKKPALQGAGQ